MIRRRTPLKRASLREPSDTCTFRVGKVPGKSIDSALNSLRTRHGLNEPARDSGKPGRDRDRRGGETARKPTRKDSFPVRIKAKRSKPRRGPLRDQAYKNWLKERKCVACWDSRGKNPPLYPIQNCEDLLMSIIDPAHTVGNGMRSKGPDSSCIPLCRLHHNEMDGQHGIKITNKAAFAEKYGLNLQNEAAAHYAAFLLLKCGDPC